VSRRHGEGGSPGKEAIKASKDDPAEKDASLDPQPTSRGLARYRRVCRTLFPLSWASFSCSPVRVGSFPVVIKHHSSHYREGEGCEAIWLRPSPSPRRLSSFAPVLHPARPPLLTTSPTRLPADPMSADRTRRKRRRRRRESRAGR
jgi:hypothetical protein